MRILVVSNLYPPHYVGGYELRCQQICAAFRRRGHDVHVLTSNHGLNPGQAPPTEDRVARTLRLHGFFGYPWLGIWALRQLEFHNNAAVRATIARVQPDVVHVWNLGGISKSVIFTLARLGVPTVYDVSDHWIARSLKADVWLDWWNRQPAAARCRLRRGLWCATGRRQSWDQRAPTNPVRQARFQRLYFCSAALRELTVAAGYPVGHGAIIHCPVDLTRFCGAPVPAERPLTKLLYVGRLAADKGVLTLLKALHQVSGRFQGELHIYGKGAADYTESLQAFVTEHQLPVRFASAAADEMPAVYRTHDALLFTSEWEEPFALTPLEAMASGLPVIGTTTGGSKELLRQRENALTYTAGDSAELAQRILELQDDPLLRARLASCGQYEVGRFAEPVILDQIQAYLEESIRTWKPTPPPQYNAP